MCFYPDKTCFIKNMHYIDKVFLTDAVKIAINLKNNWYPRCFDTFEDGKEEK